MISEVIVPDLGATGGDMTLSAWLIKPNDFVKAGSPLFAVTTDKADMEVEAFRDGYVREILVSVESRVAVGTVVARLADSLEEPLICAPSSRTKQSPLAHRPQKSAESLGVNAQEQHAENLESLHVLASPLARRMAQEKGVDLGSVLATSDGGRIHKRDILAAALRQGDHGLPPVLERQNQGVMRRTPITPMRKAIAERTRRSKADVPHFYVTVMVDVTDALGFLKQVALRLDGEQAKPSLTDVALRAAAVALRHNLQLNASFQEDEVVYFEDVNIGLVVALDDGMIVPVIARADRNDLYAIAAVRRQLQEKAKSGKLLKAELTGSTFTISNLGMYGIESFVAVINPPEAAILALGSARERVSIREGQIQAREEMTVTLSADHRLVDGVAAARFLNEFKNIMENPARLALDSAPIHSI